MAIYRLRGANGRFLRRGEIDHEAIRPDYEGDTLTVVQVAIKHRVSASTIHRLVVQHGWTPRAPHRIDPNDLIMRMFAALDAQMRDLESTMIDTNSAQVGMLNKLVATLDKLIEIKEVEASRNRRRGKPSAKVAELRSRIAERIAELNEA